MSEARDNRQARAIGNILKIPFLVIAGLAAIFGTGLLLGAMGAPDVVLVIAGALIANAAVLLGIWWVD